MSLGNRVVEAPLTVHSSLSPAHVDFLSDLRWKGLRQSVESPWFLPRPAKF